MSTYERQIDALGGSVSSEGAEHQAFNKGWNSALELAASLGADADQVIAELIETIEDMLNGGLGGQSLHVWVLNAETLVRRVKGRVQ